MREVIAKLTLVACLVILSIVPARANEARRPLVSVSKEAKAKLNGKGTVAVFLSGNDALLTRIVEDALAIHLANAGFGVTNREKLEKSVGEEIAKRRKEKEGGSVNALEIGKAVKADLVLTGTAIVESAEQKALLVRIASFQLLDVAREETLISVLSEPEKGQSFSQITRDFVDILKQNMK